MQPNDNVNSSISTPSNNPQNTQISATNMNVPRNLDTAIKSRAAIISGIVVIAIIVVAGISYAYYRGFGPFNNPPYDTAKLSSSIYSGFSKIKTSSYTFNLNIQALPKEAGIEPFDVAVPSDPNKAEAYKRDLDTARDVQSITQALQTYNYKNKSYPYSLSQLQLTLPTKNSYQYSATKGNTDFSLTFNFETGDAIDAVRSTSRYYPSAASSTTINGNTVTFTKNSYTYLYLPSTPKQPAIVDILNLQSSLSYIPGDFRFDGTVIGSYDEIDANTANSQVDIKASTSFNDMNVGIDMSFKKILDDYYVVINKFPSFFSDTSKIKGKWIKIAQTDIANLGSSYLFGSGIASGKDEIAKTKARAIEQFKLFLSIADQDNALTNSNHPSKESVNGLMAYRYDLELNKDNFVKFYTDLTSQFGSKYLTNNPFVFDQSTLDYLKSPEFDKVFAYLRTNTSFTLWADGSGIPVRMQYGLKLVPGSDTKSSDNEFKLVVTLDLNDINKNTSITAPANAISYQDATIIMTGQTKEQYLMKKQESSISELRSALESYHYQNKSYPATLDGLTISNGKYNSMLSVMPKDAYTGDSFSYVGTGSDYKLTYNIQLPKYVTGDSLYGLYERDYSSTKPRLSMIAVDGTNTADSKYASEEAHAQSLIDSDGDGLPDAFEKYIGTDPNKKDTDGDGYSDYEEVISGSNPLGPGKLKSSNGYMYY